MRAAERDLAAATARIGVATADLFPRVLEAAIALETKIIRVWAGHTGSDRADKKISTQITQITQINADGGGTFWQN